MKKEEPIAAIAPSITRTALTRPAPPQEPLASRRKVLQAGTLLCMLSVQHLAIAAPPKGVAVRNGLEANNAAKGKSGIVAVRVWPSEDYSRITIESDNELKASHQLRQSPAQMVVEIKNLQLSPELRNVVTKVQAEDPNIATIHIAQQNEDTVRMVIELKQAVKPEIFTLKPIPPYHWRLVFDLYPEKAVDPLQELIDERLRQFADQESVQNPAPAPAPQLPKDDPLGDWISKNGDKPGPTPVPPPPIQPTKPPEPTPVPPPAPRPEPPQPAPTNQRTDRIIIVALDPGHGGEDPGAIGPGGTMEKTVVLAIGLALRDRINRTRINGIPMQAFMTRDRDFFVPLGVRVQKTRRVKADLFLSIHADGFTNPNARGAGVYALSQRGASSTTARWLADKENQSDQVGGVNVKTQDRHVQEALLDMSTSAQIRDSLQLGTMLTREMEKFAHMHKKRVEQANFAVLRNPDTPSVLVETAFITNPGEERLLRDRSYQQKMADALLDGIVQYLRKYPPQPRVRAV